MLFFIGSHKGVNGMLTNDGLKSNPNLSIPLNIDVENKVILCLLVLIILLT